MTLLFTTLDDEIFSEDFIFTRGSEIVLSVSLAGNGDVVIADGDYEVTQGRINLDGDRSFIFANALGLTTPARANLTIIGSGSTCIKLRDTASVIIEVLNFLMDNCGNNGIGASNNSTVAINASVDFEIQSSNASVEAANNASVELSGENDFTMESLSEFAIVGRGASITTVNDGMAAPNSCLIAGIVGSFITNDTATVDIPASCEP